MVDGEPRPKNPLIIDTRAHILGGEWKTEEINKWLKGRWVHFPDAQTEGLSMLRDSAKRDLVVLCTTRMTQEQIREMVGGEYTLLDIEREKPVFPPDGGGMIGASEAAAYLGISYATVRFHLYQSGRLRPYGVQMSLGKTKKYWFFTKKSLDQYMQDFK